ncbi:MAG: hypothetical protein R3C52_03255 [Hyphomonadaceae bacterium]
MTTQSGGSGSGHGLDVEALKREVEDLRKEVSGLVQTTAKAANERIRKASKQAGDWANDAGKHAVEYRDDLEDRIREHPFTALGLAVAAGFVVAAITRRR